MAKTVLTAAERIMEKFGGTWEQAGEEILKPPPAIPTGSILLDNAIGDCNGWPDGAIVEAFGPQHSGKTLMGYLAILASQRKNPDRPNLLMDAEHQFKFQARWAKQVGIDVTKLFVTPVVSAEECFDKIEMAILGDVELDADGDVKKIHKAGNFGVIMIDSVTQLVPLDIINKSMDDSKRMGLLAARMSEGLKKVVSAMSRVNSPTILFFINQTRVNPQQMFGCFHASTRIKTVKKDYYISQFVHKKNNDDIITLNEENNSFEITKPIQHYKNGKAKREDFVKICFQTPSHRKYQQIICTKNHKILTDRGWVEANDLDDTFKLISCCNNPLTEIEEQILIGSLLGDGQIINTENILKGYFRLQNSEQPEYLKWKMEILKNIKFKKHNNGFKSTPELFLTNYFREFYLNESSKTQTQKLKKRYRTFTEKTVGKIKLLALAVLYMDDGCLMHSDRPTHEMLISMKRLRDLPIINLLPKMFEKYGINVVIKKDGIFLDKENSYSFSNLIKEFIVPSMQYKLWEDHRGYYKQIKYGDKIIGLEKLYVSFISKKPISNKEALCLTKYDIQTKNSNYMVGSARDFNGIVVHNSPEVRTGGNSLPFYDTIAVRVTKVRDSEERDAAGKIFAHQAKIVFDKNKAGQKPAYPIVFRICYDGKGIDNDRERLWVAVRNNLIITKNVDEKKDPMLGVFSDEKKTARFLVIKQGTTDPIDDNMKWFQAGEFKDILEKYPNLKATINKLIKDGKFYADPNIEEDEVKDLEESDDTKKKKKEPEEKAEAPAETQEEKPEKPQIVEKSVEESKTEVKATEKATETTEEAPKLIRRRGRPKKVL